MYTKSFDNLIQAFHRLPGVGLKSAERYAYALINMDHEDYTEFLDAVKNLTKISRCKICGNLCEGDICEICSSSERNKNLICVVHSPKDLMTIESLHSYDGVYHILNGAINTAKGILPQDLNIDSLLQRINPQTQEVILALDPTVEGETTALYLEKLLADKTAVSHLAQGIPSGARLDYTDARTLQKALNGRILLKKQNYEIE